MEKRKLRLQSLLTSILFCFSILNTSAQTTTEVSHDTINDSVIVIRKNVVVENIDYIDVYIKSYTEIVASPIFIKNYFKKNSTENQLYKDTHSNNIGYMFGFKQGLQLNTWQISLGIIYKRYYDFFNYCDLTGPRDTTYQDFPTYTLVTTTSKTYNSTFTNNILNIPVLLGYQATFKHFFVSFQTGLDLNIFIKPEGKMVLNNQIETISKHKFNNINYGINTNINVGYKLSKALFIFISPCVIFPLTPIHTDATGIQQKNILAHTILGVRKYF